jgi:hypothetical protein
MLRPESSRNQTSRGRPARRTYSGSAFAVVGELGGIATSPDGFTWTTRSPGTTRDLLGATWAGSRLVVVGAQGTIVVSP